jgi:hypothetical protein
MIVGVGEDAVVTVDGHRLGAEVRSFGVAFFSCLHHSLEQKRHP